MTVTFVRKQVQKNGNGTYAAAGYPGRVWLSGKLFTGEIPESFTIEADNFVEQNAALAEKSEKSKERDAQKLARAEAREAKAADRAKKAAENAEKLRKRLGAPAVNPLGEPETVTA